MSWSLGVGDIRISKSRKKLGNLIHMLIFSVFWMGRKAKIFEKIFSAIAKI